MSVSLSTRGILCLSSPSVARATWGVICIPLTPSIPSFIVGPQVFCPEVLFNKTLDLSTNTFDIPIVTPIAPTLTSPVLYFSTNKEPELFNKGTETVVNKPKPDLVSSGDNEQNFNKEDPDIFSKEDPELINGPDWKGLDECP